MFVYAQVSSPELKANIAAAHASRERSGSFEAVEKARGISAKDSFEVAFNLACIRLQAGDLDQASELLQLSIRTGLLQSERVCFESGFILGIEFVVVPNDAVGGFHQIHVAGRESLLEDDFTEEQVEQELAPLNVQQAYASASAGQHRTAADQYQVARRDRCRSS